MRTCVLQPDVDSDTGIAERIGGGIVAGYGRNQESAQGPVQEQQHIGENTTLDEILHEEVDELHSHFGTGPGILGEEGDRQTSPSAAEVGSARGYESESQHAPPIARQREARRGPVLLH